MGYWHLYGEWLEGLGVLAMSVNTNLHACSLDHQKKIMIPQSTIDKPPSAELKAHHGTPIRFRYAIGRCSAPSYVEDLLSPEEIVKKYNFPLELVIDSVHRIHASEYKRRPIGSWHPRD